MTRKDRVPCIEAVKRVEQTKRTNEENVRGEIPTGNMWTQSQDHFREKEKRELGKKRNLVIFIAGLISATADAKSKTTKVQIITMHQFNIWAW